MSEVSPYHSHLENDHNDTQEAFPVRRPRRRRREPENLSSADTTPAVLAHVLAFCGYIIPFGHIVAPLIIYLVKKDDSPYARHHAAESLNFQISMTIYMVVSLFLVLVLVGIFMLLALLIIDIILIIVAAVQASNRQWFRYPLNIRFVS